MNLVELPCKKCGGSVEVAEEFGGVAPVCERCSTQIAREESRQATELAALARWHLVCPPRFHDTALPRLPRPQESEKALAWTRRVEGNGLNLWGFPDTGKTRTLLLILRREHLRGATVKLFMAGDFELGLERRAFKRGPWLLALRSVDMLAFDDFDKLNLTREGERIFFQLIDSRMNQRRPVLLTHNSTAKAIEYRFRCGEPLVRRIRDFCSSVHFPAQLL